MRRGFLVCQLVLLAIVSLAEIHTVTSWTERDYEASFILSEETIPQAPTSCNVTEQQKLQIQKVILRNGRLYIGATNHVLQLAASNLRFEAQFNTGPTFDNEQCTFPHFCQGNHCASSCVSNYNKLLLSYRDIVIACGTAHRICYLLQAHNVSLPVVPENDKLHCGWNEDILISIRNKSLPLVASVYSSGGGDDLFYVGGSDAPNLREQMEYSIKTYRAPRTNMNYFENIDDSSKYLPLKLGDRFIHSWTTSKHGYLMWIDSNSTRLARYCHRTMLARQEKDVGKASYVEIGVQCIVGSVVHNVAISAEYLNGSLYVLFTGADASALCVSSLADVNRECDNARRSCFEGWSVQVKHIETNKFKTCKNISFNEEEVTCGFTGFPTLYIYGGVHSLDDITMTHVLSLQKNDVPEPTVFAVSKKSGLSVAFIGTSDGYLLKAGLKSPNKGISERIRLIPNDAVLYAGLDAEQEHVYSATSTQVFKFTVQSCEKQYRSCSSCLASVDPYCGWCVKESKCSPSKVCDDTKYWIASGSNPATCPALSKLQPSAIPIRSKTQIKLRFSGTPLPVQQEIYKCVFTVADLPTMTSQIIGFPSDPYCPLTSTANFTLSYNSDHVNVTLHIEYNQKVMTSPLQLYLYDCSRVKKLESNKMETCASCLTSKWNCSWCVGENTCTSSGTCPAQSIMLSNATFCPRIDGFVHVVRKIPYGQAKTFTINVVNFPQTCDLDNGNILTTLYVNKLFCKNKEAFSRLHTHTTIHASFAAATQQLGVELDCVYERCGQVSSSRVIFNSTSMIISCKASETHLSCPENSFDVQIFLSSPTTDYVIDNPVPTSTSVTIFNCKRSSGDCGSCLSFRKRFSSCSWCKTPSPGECAQSCASSHSVTRIQECGAGVVESFSPLSGPVQGETTIVVKGFNLGTNRTQIELVKIGRVICNIIEYIPSKQIQCVVRRASGITDSGSVRIRTSYNSIITSSEPYRFKVVSTSSFEPSQVLNRSLITISGSQLDVGSEASIIVEDGNETWTNNVCSRTSSILRCETPLVPTAGNYSLHVKIDGYHKLFETSINYLAQPSVISTDRPLQSFGSGGRDVTIILTSVDGIQTAAIQIGQSSAKSCKINKTLSGLLCNIPGRVPYSSSRQRRSIPFSKTQVAYAALILNDYHRIRLGNVTYHSDPVVNPLSQIPCESSNAILDQSDTGDNAGPASDVISVKTVSVQVQGSGFIHVGTLIKDYVVTLTPVDEPNKIRCDVFYIDAISLICRALAADLDRHRNNKINIDISVGSWNQTLQDALYCPSSNSWLVAYISVPILAIFILIIIFLVFRHRRRTKMQKRERKLMLSKLGDLENKTRETARNAYIELQVGYMANLAENLTDRINYLTIPVYFTQTFFNQTSDHPVMNRTAFQQGPCNTVEALKDWIALLKQKDFLILFVQTLEDEKKFTFQDKRYVASCLMTSMLSDLPYYTRVMFDLLSELISKHIARNPKFMLRRSESVVEKMLSHWFSVVLYDECIKEGAGKPIYLLSKAIHYLVTSAPCDVVANKAVNSLNEMTLLGTELVFDTMTLQASVDHGSGGDQPTPIEVKVVDVDSITQVKAKIIQAVFKDKPFSECPKTDDLELELVSSADKREGIFLADIDSTSKQDGGCMKLNTLKHYNIPNGAVVVLRPPSDRSTAVSTSPQDLKSPLLSSRVYHLIHPRDNDSANGKTETEDNHRGKRANAMINDLVKKPFQEIYLTRMIRAKTTLQEYVDGVFNAILCPNSIPKLVLYFFRFLEQEAMKNNISEPEVIDMWKTNSLLLRYWVNVLKNPEFLFDTQKTELVDSCLNVITEAFMDACTTTCRKLGLDSPSNKVLYAKDAEHYKTLVKEFFVNISNTAHVEEEEVTEILRQKSREYGKELNDLAAANLLYGYMRKYQKQVLQRLRDTGYDVFASKVETLGQVLREDRTFSTTIV